MNLAELPWNECVSPSMENLQNIDFTKCETGSPILKAKHIGLEVAICDYSPESNGCALAVKTISGDWIWALQISGRKLDTCVNVVTAAAKVDAFIERESSKPRLPKVNAPDGWRWTFHPVLGLCLVQGETGEKRFNQIPLNKNNRDVLAALVIAYDELNPTKGAR